MVCFFCCRVLCTEQLDNINDNDYLYSSDVLEGEKIAIYGFGPYGKLAFLDFLSKNKITAIYDQNFSSFNKNVRSPELIDPTQFDYIILSVMNKKAAQQIRFFLEKNIDKQKIISIEYSIKSPIL
ncbi:hypothetical protein [Succinivibrio dextrinosolvens]|uniref:hypothetical protein n=1 Tax=Succinivibrio dextrinosolvens TaxID=83771 RepID=UPI001923E224|nr:hypothetical protein [Succinivibrio dextrinosolvens]